MFSLGDSHTQKFPSCTKRIINGLDNLHIAPIIPLDHNCSELLAELDFYYMKGKLIAVLLTGFTAVGCQAITPQNSNHASAPPSIEEITYGPPPHAQFDTSGWRNYSDTAIAFKYPPDWKVATGKDIGAGFFTINLYDRNTYYSEGGTVVSPIQISYKADTYGGSINGLFTNPVAQQTVQKQHIKIGGRDAYVLKGSLPPGTADMRVVFTNNTVFEFDSNAASLPISMADLHEIDAVFETVLATVQFR